MICFPKVRIFDQILGPTVGILTKNSCEKSNAPHMPEVPPSALTLIDALDKIC